MHDAKMGNLDYKSRLVKSVVVLVVLGVPLLLFLGAGFNVLSPREVAGGVLAWFVGILIWAAVAQFLTRKSLASAKEPVVPLDDRTRRRIIRRIRTYKIWFGVLVVCLPLGIANGVAQRAWLQTIVAIGISLFLMYGTLQVIRGLRKRLDLDIGSVRRR